MHMEWNSCLKVQRGLALSRVMKNDNDNSALVEVCRVAHIVSGTLHVLLSTASHSSGADSVAHCTGAEWKLERSQLQLHQENY